MDNWKMRFGYLTAETRFPGVYRLKEGGHLVRARVQDPRTRQLKEVRRVLSEVRDAAGASRILQDALAQVREDAEPQKQIPTLKSYTVLWLERRINRGTVASAATRRVYGETFKQHFYPRFGLIILDQLRRSDIEEWCDEMGRLIQAGNLSPRTANTRMGLLRAILRSAARDYGIRNVADGVESFDIAEHPTYTEEEPNSLTADEVPRFLETCRSLFPGFYALVCLGYATGLRPSSLRPLRKSGPTPDLVLNPICKSCRGNNAETCTSCHGQSGTASLYVRRSHTTGVMVMETTKTKRHGRIHLPSDLADVLTWHIGQMNEAQKQSDLLFPNLAGELYTPARLWQIWPSIAKQAGIQKHLTPRCMRRTFQDLCRRAAVQDLVTRSISGHATEAMQHHYSTVGASEQRQALAKVVDLMAVKRAMGGASGGVNGAVAPPADMASDEEARAG